MNKKDAAAFLGVTTKTVERHVNAGRLNVRKVRGDFGMVADYDEDELKRLKKELDPTYELETDSNTDMSETVSTTGRDIVLSRPLYQTGQGQTAIETVSETPLATGRDRQQTDIVPIPYKLLWDVKEVSALTGLSQKIIRVAIASGELKSGRVGKSFRIRPDDLKAWLNTLY